MLPDWGRKKKEEEKSRKIGDETFISDILQVLDRFA